MSTRGVLGLKLESRCRMMAAPERRDGMLLCGVGAAYILIVVQAHWALMIRPRGVTI